MATTKIITEVTDLNAASSTNGLKMPTGGAYSGTPTDGMVRNSSETGSQGSANVMQHYNGTEWKNYENLSSSFSVDFLVVAGGGGGGPNHGGGGGAGGYLTTTTYSGSETPLTASLGTAYDVTVGPGGVGGTGGIPGTSGSNSEFNGITSTGGGGGGYNNSTGVTGGSGGGGSRGAAAGSGTSGQGNSGGTGVTFSGGGGGGASATGSNGSTYVGGNGGAGTDNSITGTSVFYAGGGGGNGYTASGGTGGVGGGGNGGQYGGGGEYIGTNGALNTGGGGGGSYSDSGTFQLQGMLGGSGIVILRYPTADVSSYAVTGTLDTTADTAYPVANLAYYKLNGDALDSSGNGYNGAASNLSPYAAGRFGQAAVFNGSSSEIVAPNSLLPSSGGFSISWWQKTTQADNTYSYTIDTGGGSLGNGLYIITHNVSTGMIVGFKNSSTFGSASIPYTSAERTQWTHFCFSWDGTTSANAFKIYKNNVPTSFTSTVTNAGSAYPFRIGRSYNGTDWFGGSIDQVRVFSSALTATNVTELYNEGTVVESTDGTDSILQFIGGTGTVTFS